MPILTGLKLPDGHSRIYQAPTDDWREAMQMVQQEHPLAKGVLALVPKVYETVTNQVA